MSDSKPKKPTFLMFAFLRRNPNLSPEQFFEHFGGHHARLAAPWAKKHGVIAYRQIHISGKIAPNFGPSNGNEVLQDFDGITVWEVEDPNWLAEAMEDPYYKDVISPDEYKMTNKGGAGGQVIAGFQGWVVDVLADREIVLDGA